MRFTLAAALVLIGMVPASAQARVVVIVPGGLDKPIADSHPDPGGAFLGFFARTVEQSPSKNAVVDDIPVGGYPGPVTAGAGSVWVALGYPGRVERVDPRTRRVIAAVPVDFCFWSILILATPGVAYRPFRVVASWAVISPFILAT